MPDSLLPRQDDPNLSEVQAVARPDRRLVANEIRRGSDRLRREAEDVYRRVTAIIGDISHNTFAKGRRLSDAEVKRLPERIGRLFEAQRSPMQQIIIQTPGRKTSTSRTWLQPHLIDNGDTRPVVHEGVQAGVIHGAEMRCLAISATRRRIVVVDRTPGFLTIQRHAFLRYATRRRVSPEHVIATLANELLPRTGIIAAQMMIQKILEDRLGIEVGLVIPLGDGLALGNCIDITAEDEEDLAQRPYGGFIVADEARGFQIYPLRLHALTYRDSPDRHLNGLVRTVVHEDMLHDDQETVWKALRWVEQRHERLLVDLYAAVWLHDLLGVEGDPNSGARLLNPSHYQPLLDDLVTVFTSPSGVQALTRQAAE